MIQVNNLVKKYILNKSEIQSIINIVVNYERKNGNANIKKYLKKYKNKDIDIGIILCSKKYLKKINKNYLKKDTETDVISFSFFEDRDSIPGDIYVSMDAVLKQAKELNHSMANELTILIIHGVLHLFDYDDKKEKNKKIMKKHEDEILNIVLKQGI